MMGKLEKGTRDFPFSSAIGDIIKLPSFVVDTLPFSFWMMNLLYKREGGGDLVKLASLSLAKKYCVLTKKTIIIIKSTLRRRGGLDDQTLQMER